MRRLVIFDWGRTLYNPDTKAVFPGVPDMLRSLCTRYDLAIVSLASDGDFERRRQAMKTAGIESLFSSIRMSRENKDALYECTLVELGYVASNVVIVDDRTVRGIRWGNTNGAQTIWLQQGKFSLELPNEETGRPNHTITRITDLLGLL